MNNSIEIAATIEGSSHCENLIGFSCCTSTRRGSYVT
jgi:hypothetical protein